MKIFGKYKDKKLPVVILIIRETRLPRLLATLVANGPFFSVKSIRARMYFPTVKESMKL